ncbi:MAG TPA: nickel pincer cofactor biosynthesis protein LarC [Candidatus Hydrogenedentes bacterium]|nr:nickel pincer cofactor biosynthesis protein LarC [Candidatus Hydrogenedentota bacterium]
MRTLYLDCFSGISGDMTVGALIDAGADIGALRAALESLNVPGFTISAEKVIKNGISATQFRVLLHEHEHPHRHLHHIVDIIQCAALPEPVKQAAIQTFTRLADAEATVHGTSPEKVHFHEVGAVDAIVDIVAAHLALHLLGIEQVVASPLHVGAGSVKCAHGWMPVPAPATALLLQGKPTYGGEVEGELTTPTGAAIVAQCAASFGGIPAMTVENIGYGAGTRDIPGRPNVLRVFIGQTDSPLGMQETITVMEATIDDMNPELFPPLLAALLEAKARDAFITPIVGKKGRPAYCITALCDAANVRGVADALFRHSSTLGVRFRQEQRFVLERHWKTVQTEWGRVRIKIGAYKGAASTAAPEFEDCRALAETAGVPVRRVYETALALAVKGEFEHA